MGGAGLFDYVGPRPASRLAADSGNAFPFGQQGQHPQTGFSETRSPSPSFPLFTLQSLPHDNDRKTRGQNGFANSFPVGLFHPLPYAGLSQRTARHFEAPSLAPTRLPIGLFACVIGPTHASHRQIMPRFARNDATNVFQSIKARLNPTIWYWPLKCFIHKDMRWSKCVEFNRDSKE